MAFDKTPTSWIANWSEDGTDISVPIASFSELTAAEADGTTGDIRDIVFAIIQHLYTTYNALATADRPDKLTIKKTATYNSVYNKLTNRYTFTIVTDIGTQEVRAEVSSSPSSSVSSSPSSSPRTPPETTC